MKILITGATSGIGKSMAKILSKDNLVVATGRNKEKLEKLKNEINCMTELCDASDYKQCVELFNKHKDAEVVINNAGFGDIGYFSETEIEKDISMINTNITGLHTLTKLYLKEMVKKDRGYILNVASVAGFLTGPLMATYYATKNYVVKLTKAINYELKLQKSNVYVGLLCPGPVDTNFNNIANVKFNLKSQTAEQVAKMGIERMFKGKKIICTTSGVKFSRLAGKLLPDFLVCPIVCRLQKKKL
jgi:short-subunit dehydrogenase